MANKRQVTEPFDVKTIYVLNDTPDIRKEDTQTSPLEEELVPENDKKGLTKWIR